MAASPEDALTVMNATAKVRHYYSNRPMLTMAMGKWGVLTRITGEGFGSDLTFAMRRRQSERPPVKFLPRSALMSLKCSTRL